MLLAYVTAPSQKVAGLQSGGQTSVLNATVTGDGKVRKIVLISFGKGRQDMGLSDVMRKIKYNLTSVEAVLKCSSLLSFWF